MPFFSILTRESGVRDILQLNPKAGRALLDFHEAVLRQPSPLGPGERELIAAYVSGLNACQYCHGVHSKTAEAFGVSESLITALITDIAAAPIEPIMRPLLAYVRKLTLTPSRMVQADADAVFTAGWSEQALHDAITVCCLFNFMNRLVEGHGIKGDAELFLARGKALQEEGYLPLIKLLGL